MQKLIQVFLDSDMRAQHDGLAARAKKENLDVHALKPGQHALFINTKLNRIKMFSPGGVLSYLRLAKGRIDLRTIHLIPQAFHDGNIELAYSKSLEAILVKTLSK